MDLCRGNGALALAAFKHGISGTRTCMSDYRNAFLPVTSKATVGKQCRTSRTCCVSPSWSHRWCTRDGKVYQQEVHPPDEEPADTIEDEPEDADDDDALCGDAWLPSPSGFARPCNPNAQDPTDQ